MEMPWLDHYDPEVPRTIGNYPDGTLVDLVQAHARRRPDAPAIIFKGKRTSFRQLDESSDALARALRNEGVGPGTRVALLLPNVPQFVIAELAVWKLGGTIAPQNPIYNERELGESLRATEPEVMIVLTPFYYRVKAVLAGTTIRRVIATNIKEYLPRRIRPLFTLLKEKKDGHRVKVAPEDVRLPRLIRQGRKAGKKGEKIVPVAKPSDDAVILMSGGTTGTPKGVVSQHRSLVMAGTQLAAWLHEGVRGEKSAMLLPLPLFHTYGCAGAQSLTMVAGIPLVLVPNPRDINDLLKTIHRDKPTLMCAVPTLFSAILSHPKVVRGRIDFDSVVACFSGAAPLMAETKKRFEALSGSRIVEGYSLTEATMACCGNPYGGVNKTGSVGLPMPDVLVRIVDPENGSAVPMRGVGEILMHAPQLMKEYWNNEAETRLVLQRATDGRLWLHTGDLGYIDEDGYVFIVDRTKDVIKAGGFQVWPREVEEVLSSHPAVAEAGVAGLPDEARGEIVAAWVVLRPGEPAPATDQLRRWCKERLAPYKVPTRIEFRGELPKTMVGKILRRQLVAETLKNGER